MFIVIDSNKKYLSSKTTSWYICFDKYSLELNISTNW